LNSDNDEIYGIVSGFDIFCFDKISSNSFSITGRIAAKNSINSSSVTLNNKAGQDCSKHSYKYAIYTDKFTMSDGNIFGGVHYKTLFDAPDSIKDDLKRNKCAVSSDSSDNLDFDLIEKRITEISNELSKLTANAEVLNLYIFKYNFFFFLFIYKKTNLIIKLINKIDCKCRSIWYNKKETCFEISN